MKKILLFGAAIAIATLVATPQTEAGRRNRGSSGSYGSAGSSGGSSGGKVGSGIRHGYSSGSYGSSGGSSSGGSYSSLGHSASSGGASTGEASSGGSSGKRRAKKVRVRKSRGSSGSYGSHGSSSGSSGGSYGSRGSHGSYGGGHAAVSHSYTAAPAFVGHAYLVVNVPQNATVTLGGIRMTGSGETRKFKIPVRSANKAYAYGVTVEYRNGGRLQTARYNKAIAAGRMTVVEARPASPAQLAAR